LAFSKEKEWIGVRVWCFVQLFENKVELALTGVTSRHVCCPLHVTNACA